MSGKSVTRQDTQSRICLLPYMGDFSIVACYAFKYVGVTAEVLPTNTEEGAEAADKHIYTETCFPLKGVVGDVLGYLGARVEEKGREAVQKEYMVAFPTTSGPCRFGKYQEILAQFLEEEGLGGVPVIGPNAENDYLDVMPFPRGIRDTVTFFRLVMRALIGSDMLNDIVLRFRPYVDDEQKMYDVKDEQLNKLCEVVERGAHFDDLHQWGEETVERFQQFDDGRRFPLVIYAGEIYMRQHDYYTDHVVRKLENQKLELIRTPIVEWVDYVNKINWRDNIKTARKAFKSLHLWKGMKCLASVFVHLLTGAYIQHIEHRIAEPFKDVLEDRHFLPKPEKVLRELDEQHEFAPEVTGEAPLNIGIAYFLMNNQLNSGNGPKVCGMFHVAPFTCMQEGVAAAKMDAMENEVRQTNPDLIFPLIHGFFGDSPNPNLDSEIAVFAEQCYAKHNMLSSETTEMQPALQT